VGRLVTSLRALALLCVIVSIAVGALLWRPAHAPPAGGEHLADADDAAAVNAGRPMYQRYCASCHGRYLQGQPLWQLIDANTGRRAPAQDASGHTWQHADAAIFHITKYGRFATTPADQASAMPAFADRLGDDQILAVIAFIKARWPLGLRVSQALLNPGHAGMPAGADAVDWRLPPTCNTVLRRASATAQKKG
jgi:S-disulfanyl-L-cysteine oxidoreductase SoxD